MATELRKTLSERQKSNPDIVQPNRSLQIRFIYFARFIVIAFLAWHFFWSTKSCAAPTETNFKGDPETAYFSTSDGERFSWQTWMPATTKLRAAIIAIPGMGGAASEIAPLAKVLQQKGIAVYALNLRGQGLDPKPDRRGRDFDVNRLLSDIRDAVAKVRVEHPDTPVLFYGESLGALLVIRLFSVPNPTFSGIILATPVIALAKPPSLAIQKLIQLATAYFPSLRISPDWFKKHPSRFSHDPEKQRFITEAPYRIKKFTLGFLSNVSLLMVESNQAAKEIQQPLLVLGAGDDDYIDPGQLNQWFEHLTSPDKTLKIFPGSYHRLLFDLDREQVTQTILSWLEAQLSKSKPTLSSIKNN